MIIEFFLFEATFKKDDNINIDHFIVCYVCKGKPVLSVGPPV